MKQPKLFADIEPVEVKGLTYREAFDRFHAANPHVGELMRREALRIKRKSTMPVIGIKLIYERLRWLYAFRTGATFKLNNNYHAYYSTWLMETTPELRGFFRTRTRRAEDRPMPVMKGLPE